MLVDQEHADQKRQRQRTIELIEQMREVTRETPSPQGQQRGGAGSGGLARGRAPHASWGTWTLTPTLTTLAPPHRLPSHPLARSQDPGWVPLPTLGEWLTKHEVRERSYALK